MQACLASYCETNSNLLILPQVSGYELIDIGHQLIHESNYFIINTCMTVRKCRSVKEKEEEKKNEKNEMRLVNSLNF